MAIIKIQAPLSGIRGKFGGMIFSANGSGNYCRSWVYPVAKRSFIQVVNRARLSTIRIAWNSLSAGEIADWNALAATPPEIDYNSLGDVVLLSGSAWHTRINLRRLQCGQAIENTAPAGVSVDPPVTFELYSHSFDLPGRVDTFDYTSGDFAGFYAILQVSVARSLVRQTQSANYLSVWNGDVVGADSTEITSELASSFGWLSLGNMLFGKLFKQSTDGIRSVPLETSCIVEGV
jgi:hypothetical protein